MGDNDTFAKLESELRRGVLVLVSLAQLHVPRYGYELPREWCCRTTISG